MLTTINMRYSPIRDVWITKEGRIVHTTIYNDPKVPFKTKPLVVSLVIATVSIGGALAYYFS